jgi:signal transduction histidine kinase
MATRFEVAYPPLPAGEMQDRIHDFDWSRTPVGPADSWSPALRTTVRNLLANRFPQLLWWGPEYISIYNDAYRPILGHKHPWGLGKPVRECWSEIWDVLKPLIDTPFHGGPATWMEDIELEIHRRGFMEETHFTVAYSPVPDDAAASGIGGVLATVHEITDKVVGERRVMILRDLGASASEAKTAEEACAAAAATLDRYPKDIPFALLYVIGDDGVSARLAASAGFRSGVNPGPAAVTLADDGLQCRAWGLGEARRTGQMQMAEDLPAVLPAIPRGPWSDSPSAAAVMPIRSIAPHQFSGFLVVGLSARLKFDDGYRSFLQLATTQIATAIANARAYEEERRRAEALAAIDRAKTQFFSNVSHEFRTPLTLMLGPLEHVLARGGSLHEEDREQITIAHRNSLRLLKLVNSLLDFSRIEAGRVRAVYAPVDLSSFTADLASNFRSAIEGAGLEFVVDCAALPQPVYVDREMWEKIVLNLL